MTVLSDKTIKEMIENKKLVPDGKAKNAKHCSYEFTAEFMLWGGKHHFLPVNERGIVIKPAQLVWIRAREEISIPGRMVGLWIQTQTLSRQGLLLLNISLIEPGYEGPLSAVLVNFGKKNVIINPNTKIAKVIFLPLDNEAAELVPKCDSKKKYDTDLMDMAANAPNTFLQLQSFLPKIEAEANAKLESMDKEIERSVATMVSETKYSLEKDLRIDMKGFFRKWGLGLGTGLLTGLVIVLFVMTTIFPRLVAEYSGVEEIARKASMAQQAETTTGLGRQIQTLEKEIESLKKQIQADTPNINLSSDTNNTILNQ